MTSTTSIETTATFGVSFIQIKAAGAAEGVTRQAIVIDNDLSKTVVALNGAHVMSFVPKGKPDLLWMSPNSDIVAGKPIRGGIPLCLPWFGPGAEGTPMHGFARIVDWAVAGVEATAEGATKVTLVLADTAESRASWPFAFAATLELVCGTDLEMKLSFENKSTEAQRVEFAYHTYFNVGDVSQIRIEGLDGLDGIDRLAGDAPIRQEGIKTIDGATTHYYSGIPDCLYIDSPNGRIKIAGDQKSAMVWNPGEGAANVPDMGEGAQVGFVCVERVDAIDTAVTLEPSATYTADMTIGWC
ncbi:D-hexose-6-phosphate mutarotase [Rhodobacteraceae bacterium RKSG542]|uniref:D-hexose-6-phosphate mutarotase n=1 Tax=Pseudovibrio flavus TaxID=2529854 RepID=UPI0012BC9C03|nr:D-hexose-6-phosphate mutarotase [Pseudovibrio flavus]MTI18360.1 D-hexose-6-phosphate mutarotase [Pseudovibrio flavus]